MTIPELIARFNVVVRTEFNRTYEEYEPRFKELMYEYESGPVESVDFLFYGFLTGMEEFTGSRIHQTFPEGYRFPIVNKEWDMAVDVKRKDLDRAAVVGNLGGLNPYTQRIGDIPRLAADHPVQLAFDMLEAGDASTYGLTMDGQTFFDTDHDYGIAAGSQSNIITNGSGVTTANLITDLGKVAARFQDFYYQQGPGTATSKRRKLNRTPDARLLIIAPTALYGAFKNVQTQGILASGEENIMKGSFDLLLMPFSDTNDWYAVLLDDPFFRPFLYQVEKPVELDYPTMQDEKAREIKTLTWGAYARYNVAYGAWWKAIMVQNA